MIIVRFQGGFANQIFQYAFYLNLCEKFSSVKIYADLSHYKKCKDHGGFKLKRFTKLNIIRKINLNDFVSVNENNFDEFVNNHSENENYYFNGYWQEERFFPKDLNRIKNIFVQDKLSSKNRGYIKGIIDSESVSVHVRRGDYVNNFMHGNIANQCYLQNSIKYIIDNIDNPHFFVFSDDIVWAKENLNFGDSSVTFITGNSDKVEQDIILMSLCKHNIIANSSFSWWAQFLNSNPQKIVIAPEYWFNQKSETTKDLVVKNSINISNIPLVQNVSNQPFFSILIPVYNTSNTVRRTLASVLNQTFNNIEVIIVDDGSTDNSYKVLQSYQLRDARIKLIKHEKNEGLLAARYTAMKEARGKYVLFIDSDDWFELDACQILYNELKNKPVDMLEFGFIREPTGIKQEISKDYGDRVEALLQRDYLSTFWNKVYSLNIVKEVVHSIAPFKCTFSEDMFYSLVFACFAKKIGYIDTYLMHYMLFTGISTQKDYSTVRIKNIINDAFAIKQQLEFFLQHYFYEKNINLESYVKKNCNNIAFMINENTNGAIIIEQLKYLDEVFDTDYLRNKYVYMSEIVSKYEKLQAMPIIKIGILLILFWYSIFKSRFKGIVNSFLKRR